MSIDVDQVLKSFTGAPLRHGEGDAKFRDVVCAALSTDIERTEGVEKYKRYQIMQKLSEAKEPINLTTEERTLIKAHIGKVLPPMFVGRIYDIIDPPGV